jgi:response regulator RpfG family c-di-GMP phosphodiesterase
MPATDASEANSLMQSLLSLAWVVEARDPYTGGHLWRVSQFSMLLAKSIGCIKIEVAKIGLGGFLHDLGKIGVPDRILNKPDKLTDEEYAAIKTHPRIGADLLSFPSRRSPIAPCCSTMRPRTAKVIRTDCLRKRFPWKRKSSGLRTRSTP